LKREVIGVGIKKSDGWPMPRAGISASRSERSVFHPPETNYSTNDSFESIYATLNYMCF
jgi:hypothetical protein